jgi:hypothetical protein
MKKQTWVALEIIDHNAFLIDQGVCKAEQIYTTKGKR